ncbi:MAG: hypothetical protein JO162_04100 [Alphaproteobacteria bacterium]|nr:hypothetical protein [Alphaproteobacteria bacterium]
MHFCRAAAAGPPRVVPLCSGAPLLPGAFSSRCRQHGAPSGRGHGSPGDRAPGSLRERRFGRSCADVRRSQRGAASYGGGASVLRRPLLFAACAAGLAGDRDAGRSVQWQHWQRWMPRAMRVRGPPASPRHNRRRTPRGGSPRAVAANLSSPFWPLPEILSVLVTKP